MALKSVKNPFAGYQGGKTFIGVSFGAFVTTGGTFTAMNATNNSVVWQKTFRPGHLLQRLSVDRRRPRVHGPGRSQLREGPRQERHDRWHRAARRVQRATGDQLAALPTAAGANAPPMTYSVNGKQYVAIYAGGSSFNSTKSHGDLVYAYALP